VIHSADFCELWLQFSSYNEVNVRRNNVAYVSYVRCHLGDWSATIGVLMFGLPAIEYLVKAINVTVDNGQ